MTLEEFLDKIAARPMPQNPIARVRLFAKELAEGAMEDVWPSSIYLFRGDIAQSETRAYLERRWNNAYPSLSLLINNGYCSAEGNAFTINKPAFDLLEEVEPANIFISYKRSESSAFALLVLARLKAEGLEPFLDLSLVPGEDWQAGLRDRIQKYDYLIVLLGRETLKSEVCIQEITWALDAKLTIIPIWHNGFQYQAADWSTLPSAVAHLLGSTHSIRVKEESALDYNNAIVELLNRFGITP
jgi:hypothetical protein